MTDIFSPEKRSQIMSAVRGKHTKPELRLRRALHKIGFRYRLHDKTLPGSPDMVFPKFRAVIFINGCFWHGHICRKDKLPKTRTEFWAAKIDRNRKRDKSNAVKLKKLGWRTLTIWECQKVEDRLLQRIIRFLKG